MRASVSWVAESVDLPPGTTPRQLGDALVRVGLEVERVDAAADAVSGPVVIGRVWSIATELQSNGKTIRWCQVDVGESERRGIVFVRDPKNEPYGTVAVFQDLYGNQWDLLQPRAS
jgi:phenylalanyl-tRNA synthetase beta chain